MNKRRIGLAALLLGFSSPTVAIQHPERFRSVEQAIDSAAGQKGVPSIVAAIFDDHAVLWKYAAGYADPASKRVPSLRTRYRVGSMAKAVTSTVLGIAIERGLIRFDTKVSVRTPAGFRQVRLRDLVNMQAGLAQSVCYQGITGEIDPDCRSAFDHQFAVSMTPGSDRYSYSNMGPQLAATALARRLNSHFETVARKMLFQPAGMIDATYDHRRINPSGAISFDQGGKPYNHDFRIVPAAGAGLEASAEDLVRFGQLHLTGRMRDGTALLSRPMLRQLHSAPNDGFYGFGWGRIGHGTSTEVLISDGQVNGGQAMLLINPARKVGAVVISNAANDRVAELALQALDTVVPGTTAAFNAAVETEQSAHEAKMLRFLPPSTFTGSGFVEVDRKRLPIAVSVRENQLSASILDKVSEQTQSETDEGFRGWEVACPNQIPACHRPGAKAKLWLSSEARSFVGQLQITSFNGQLPFGVRIESR